MPSADFFVRLGVPAIPGSGAELALGLRNEMGSIRAHAGNGRDDKDEATPGVRQGHTDDQEHEWALQLASLVEGAPPCYPGQAHGTLHVQLTRITIFEFLIYRRVTSSAGMSIEPPVRRMMQVSEGAPSVRSDLRERAGQRR